MWLHHLEFDWTSPLWLPYSEELSRSRQLVRYDQRGCGLSDRQVTDVSVDALVDDLEVVVDSLGLDRFNLFGTSYGGVVATIYASRHPERVSRIVLYGAYARGWARRADPREEQRAQTLIALARQGWGQEDRIYRQMIATIFAPEAAPEHVGLLCDQGRACTSGESVARQLDVFGYVDITGVLPTIQAPTLVLHRHGDTTVPFEEGRRLAAGIPGARLIELPGRNHFPLPGEAAQIQILEEINRFLPGVEVPLKHQVASHDSSKAKAPPVEQRSSVASTLAADSPSQWQVGEQRAHYRVVSALGAGGMGVVYRARDTRLERDVAVKVLPSALTTDPAARARLAREAQAASALNHPNICTIYEVGEAAGHAYIAMEYVEGRSLASSIPSDGLPIENVIRYGEQMADGLAHAHDRNVLHRDLKSANVIVTAEGRAKILDFGLAKRIGAEADAATLSQVSPLTQAGAIAGTLHYLPPEVLRGEPADARSDIWSLGVVLYEMASGKLPFQGRTSFEVTSGILREPPAVLPARVPPGLRAVIQRCLAKEPGQRYQRASEVRAALEAIGSVSSPALVGPEVTKRALPPAERMRQWFSDSGKSTTQESMSVLRIWFLWVAGMIVLFGLFVIVTIQIKKWSGSPQSAPAASLVGPRLSNGGKPSANPAANGYFEKGWLFLRGQYDLPRAQQMIAKAIEADPEFAEAYAVRALMHVLAIQGGYSNDAAEYYRTEQDIRRALALDPESAEARATLGSLYLHQGRLQAAFAEIQQALQMRPNYVSARHWLMHYHGLLGDFKTAEMLARENLRADPLFWPAQLALAGFIHRSGDAAAAVREVSGILEQDPDNSYALRTLARSHLQTGDTKTAKIFLDRIHGHQRSTYWMQLVLALQYAREGKRREALRLMNRELLKYAEINAFATLEAAEVYAVLNESDSALEWLERAVRNGNEQIEWFRRSPFFANLQEHPRFKQIIDSVEFNRKQR